jgi:amino acid efflux transporter
MSLRKSITWIHGAALTTCGVLGSGVLVLPASAALIAGPASLLRWLFMGMLAFPIAMTLGELATPYPDAGGIAAYVRAAYGQTAATVAGWIVTAVMPVGAPAAVLIGANYVGAFLSLSPLQVNLLAGLMLAMALAFNYRGIEFSGTVRVVVVMVIALIIMAAVAAAAPHVSAGEFEPFAPKGWLPVGTAMTVPFWGYIGWESVVHLVEEFKNPSQDVKTALMVSMALANVLYFYHFRPNIAGLMRMPSITYICLYIMAMSSALKLVPRGSAGRCYAAVSLVVCCVVFAFSGRAALYPALVAGGALGFARLPRSRRREPPAAPRAEEPAEIPARASPPGGGTERGDLAHE